MEIFHKYLLFSPVPANITEPPVDTVAVSGDNVTFHCMAIGLDRPSIVWYSAESIISDGSDFQITQELGGSSIVSYLTIIRVGLDLDGTTYTCFASNPPGNTSASATLYILCKSLHIYE